MNGYLFALWFAVGLNVVSTCFQIWRGVIYQRRINELHELMDRVHDTKSILDEYIVR